MEHFFEKNIKDIFELKSILQKNARQSLIMVWKNKIRNF